MFRKLMDDVKSSSNKQYMEDGLKDRRGCRWGTVMRLTAAVV